MAGGDRPAVSASSSSRQAVEAVWRIESARTVGTLARFTGDFALAEDLAQEALAEALVSWPRDGVPRNPAGWLLTVGRRRAIDTFRRRSALAAHIAQKEHFDRSGDTALYGLSARALASRRPRAQPHESVLDLRLFGDRPAHQADDRRATSKCLAGSHTSRRKPMKEL